MAIGSSFSWWKWWYSMVLLGHLRVSCGTFNIGETWFSGRPNLMFFWHAQSHFVWVQYTIYVMARCFQISDALPKKHIPYSHHLWAVETSVFPIPGWNWTILNISLDHVTTWFYHLCTHKQKDQPTADLQPAPAPRWAADPPAERPRKAANLPERHGPRAPWRPSSGRETPTLWLAMVGGLDATMTY